MSDYVARIAEKHEVNSEFLFVNISVIVDPEQSFSVDVGLDLHIGCSSHVDLHLEGVGGENCDAD